MGRTTWRRDELPVQYGRFELLERIGFGGMAEVFRARLAGAAGFEKTVVIKRILPHLAGSQETVDHFVAEAKLAGRIQHQNIIAVFEFEKQSSGEFYLAMEHVDGTDMRELLVRANSRGVRIPVWFGVYVMTKVLAALSYLHGMRDEQGAPLHAVHRDVSPPNILISRRGEVKIGDFGVAKWAGAGLNTSTGVIKGKISYCSPEHLDGQPVDPRSDVYSAGVVLWELLTQRKLFDEGNPIVAIDRICAPERVRASAINSAIPKALDDCVLRAVAADPSARFGTADELRRTLLGLLATLKPSMIDEDASVVLDTLMAPVTDEETVMEQNTVDPFSEERTEVDLQETSETRADKEDVWVVMSTFGTEVVDPIDIFTSDVELVVPVEGPTLETAHDMRFGFRLMTTAGVEGPYTWKELVAEVARAGRDSEVSADGERYCSVRAFGRAIEYEHFGGAPPPIPPHAENLIAQDAVAALGICARDHLTGRLFAIDEERFELVLRQGRPVEIHATPEALQLPALLIAEGLVDSAEALGELIQRVLNEEVSLPRLMKREAGIDPERLGRIQFAHRMLALLRRSGPEFRFVEEEIDESRTVVVERMHPLLISLTSHAFRTRELEERTQTYRGARLVFSQRFVDELPMMPFTRAQQASIRRISDLGSIDALPTSDPECRRLDLATVHVFVAAGLLLVDRS